MKAKARKVKAHRARAQHKADKHERAKADKAHNRFIWMMATFRHPRTTRPKEHRARRNVLRGPLSVLDWHSANVGIRQGRQRQKVVSE